MDLFGIAAVPPAGAVVLYICANGPARPTDGGG